MRLGRGRGKAAGTSRLGRVGALLIRGYQVSLGVILPPSCRYWPSCSEYARQALMRYGVVRGGFLALKRVARCHPWGGGGLDPVP